MTGKLRKAIMALHNLECALRNDDALKYEVRAMREVLSSRQAEAKEKRKQRCLQRSVMPRRVKELPTPMYVELFLPPAFEGDFMATEPINVNNHLDLARWQWWSSVYRGEA